MALGIDGETKVGQHRSKHRRMNLRRFAVQARSSKPGPTLPGQISQPPHPHIIGRSGAGRSIADCVGQFRLTVAEDNSR